MKWFSNDWRTQFSDEQRDVVRADYEANAAVVRSRGDAGLMALLDLNLHDGQVRSVSLDGDRFEWRFLMGDLQSGYETATVLYGDATVWMPEEMRLDGLTDPQVELLYDEIESVGDGFSMHRVLLWPKGEVWIRFRSVDVARVPALATDRRSEASGPFWRLSRRPASRRW